MGLIFVPSNDLSTSAAVATSIDRLDFGFIQAGETSTQVCRVGSLQSFGSVSLSPTDVAAWVAISPASFDLAPDEISNTVVISITPPIEAETASHSIDLVASTDLGEQFILRLDFEAVGANVARDSQYPERRTNFTDNVSDVVLRASEPLRLLTFTPVPFNPSDTRIRVDFTQRRNLYGDAGDHRFITQSVEEQLNPMNSSWGYVRSESTILGSFQDEDADIAMEFESLRTVMRYSCKARLFVPPEYEFSRFYGLFSVGKSADFDQYKRTVYLIQRRGEFWCLHFVATRNRGNELAHHEIDLVQLEDANMGSPDFYNPFAWTWRLESDKPYAKFPVPHNLFTSIEDGSGSLAGSLSS